MRKLGLALLAAALAAGSAGAAAPGDAHAAAYSRGEDYVNAWDGSRMIYIPGGVFMMGSAAGSDDEKPIHKVTLSPYHIGRTETTWAQYARFCRATRHALPERPDWCNRDDYAVFGVSWDDAGAYCRWAGLRLPTEAEWEFAARGTDGRTYPWGNEPPGEGGAWRANCGSGAGRGDGFEFASLVGRFPTGASPWRCLDMAGNVAEWCSDWYDPLYYQMSPARDPSGPTRGTMRVLRGGSWSSLPSQLRATRRDFARSFPTFNYFNVGFRVAK
ncbi:MAG: SUMF1/EgtB/PvdO family nonheme iron enzyme [Candidatus Wallbacteria bacterium]|nr:SUMF1/EgtB/PvdO family nonheme iron enzyme [Candidatus Wallbacteria bacterium]